MRTDPPNRSWAAVPAAGAVLVAGIVLGRVWVVIPFLLGIALLYVTLAFLSSRLNPLSIGFYLTVKPAWSAIGVVALCGVGLLALGYMDLVSGLGPVVPTALGPP